MLKIHSRINSRLFAGLVLMFCVSGARVFSLAPSEGERGPFARPVHGEAPRLLAPALSSIEEEREKNHGTHPRRLNSTAAASDVPPAKPAAAGVIVLPKSVPDPLEPINRVMWAFNKVLLTDFIKPTSRIYRFLVMRRIRLGIGNIGRNLTYPDRVINNLLQGKWKGARDESYRFVCNTTIGIAGYFDVAAKWKIEKSAADFGQTFGQWGWKPACYLMLPVFGPSNERDALGLGADTAANPLIYIAPYHFVANNPLTYLGPYTYFSYAIMYNDLSDSVVESVRFSEAESDPYAEIQYAWTFARENRAPDLAVRGETDEPSLETLKSTLLTCKDPEFPDRGLTRSALIPTTGRKLKFTYWLQKGRAPVVYVIPGLGSHRLAETSLALAELVYQGGFSVVCVSSPFNSEFMEHASTAAMPAYLPVDGHDLHMALTEINRSLNEAYPRRLGKKALIGYSMGAFDTLYVAATAATNQPPLVQFDRYVAIDTPVRLIHGVEKLDEFYQAPAGWPAAERTGNIENTFLKVAALKRSNLLTASAWPFSGMESEFLVGLTFREILRDIIFSSQRRNNQGILQHPLRGYRREPAYQEILAYSYRDYFEKFVAPYYQSRNITPAALETAGDLRTYSGALGANPNIRVIINQNDFLLAEGDLDWLRATFPSEKLTVFEHGGHLGNLASPNVQQSILGTLAGLESSAASSN